MGRIGPLTCLNYSLRALLAFVFVYAAVGKLRSGLDPAAGQTLYDAYIRPGSIGHYLFVGGEFLLGAWVLSGVLPRMSASTAAGVLAIFSGLIAYETTKAAPRDCGCLGGGKVVEVLPNDVRPRLYRSLTMNAVLIVPALWLIVMPTDQDRRRPAPAASSVNTPDAPRG